MSVYKHSFYDERKLAWQTTADELIIRILRGTNDSELGYYNTLLFPRLTLFLFNDDGLGNASTAVIKTRKKKIAALWSKNNYKKHGSKLTHDGFLTVKSEATKTWINLMYLCNL